MARERKPMSNAPRVGRASRTRKPDLWYYDRLPPTARVALANTAFSWSAGGMFNKWRRGKCGYKSGADIAARVRAADQKVLKKTGDQGQCPQQ